jgi:drug/metabolite transporter (DMT)-like permease
MNNKVEHNYAIPVLVAAVCAVSTAAPLAKFAGNVHPIAIGFWRTLIVGCVLAISVPRKISISKKNWILALFAGLLLALHFWAWFASLRYTSALRSTTLVCLNPIWAGVLEGVFLKNKPSKYFWGGVLIAVGGVVVMTSGDLSEGALLGDSLALLGGIFGAIYLIVGRVVRQDLDINTYGTMICLTCAGVLFLFSLPMEIPMTGYGYASWVALVAMAIGPQFTGHIGLNYCVRYISAASISLTLLLEPVGAAVLALLFLNEVPTSIEIVGAVLILIGVGFGSRS